MDRDPDVSFLLGRLLLFEYSHEYNIYFIENAFKAYLEVAIANPHVIEWETLSEAFAYQWEHPVFGLPTGHVVQYELSYHTRFFNQIVTVIVLPCRLAPHFPILGLLEAESNLGHDSHLPNDGSPQLQSHKRF